MKKSQHRISLSTVRRANDSLVASNSPASRLEARTLTGGVVVKTIYSGRQYQVDLTPTIINDAFGKSVENSKVLVNEQR